MQVWLHQLNSNFFIPLSSHHYYRNCNSESAYLNEANRRHLAGDNQGR